MTVGFLIKTFPLVLIIGLVYGTLSLTLSPPSPCVCFSLSSHPPLPFSFSGSDGQSTCHAGFLEDLPAQHSLKRRGFLAAGWKRGGALPRLPLHDDSLQLKALGQSAGRVFARNRVLPLQLLSSSHFFYLTLILNWLSLSTVYSERQ